MSAIDFDLVRHALDVAVQSQMNEVELEVGGAKFSAVIEKKAAPKAAPAVAGESALRQVSEPEPTTKPIKATSVGIFRTAKVPLIAGATVEKGDVIGTIFALGISTEVHSSINGTIADILVEDGDPVEYGQPIMEILI
jgi:acetyl-CoA carboxylase biotin carboxyl carrier protein